MDLGIGGLGYATEIGAGASAIVYKARQLDLDREVAVKVLSVTDEAFVRRFRREAKTLGKLSQNPGIVTVYDTGVTSAGQPFLILELCQSSVLDHLNSAGQFDPMNACRAIAQVADAVSDAHENGVVHRDLKPGNVLLSQTGRYMVTDFGISTVTGATMGQTNSVGFTAGYVAPETLTDAPVGAPSDVYALGATLFHMVAGRAPFVVSDQGANLLALAQRVVNDPVPDLRSEGVPDPVCEAIEAAMAKKPEDRPTAAQLRDRLQTVTGDGPALSTIGTTSAGIDGSDLVGSGRDGAAAGAVGAMGVAGAAAGAVTGTDATISAAEPPLSAASNSSTAIHNFDPPAPGPGGPGPNPSPATGPGPAAGPGSDGGDFGQPAPGIPVDRPILSQQATSLPPALGPTPEERRYRFTADDSRQIGPLVVGALVGLLALIGVGAWLVSQTGGDSGDDDGIGANIAAGPSSSVEATGNEATDQDGGGNRGSLSSDGSSTSSTDPAVMVRVPDVAGDSAADAEATLRGLGLLVNRVDEQSDSVPVGRVVRQLPGSGAQLERGDVVSIYISVEGAIETVPLPRLAGMTLADADSALTALGLTSTVTRENSDTVPVDSVISSSPDVGTTVNVGAAITLVVSDGPASAICEDVIGLTGAAATGRLQASDLTVTSETAPSATVAEGLVISCTQTATTASLTISSGPDPCQSIIGTDRTTAQATLEGMDLTVTAVGTPSGAAADEVLTCSVTGSTAQLTYATPLPNDCPPVVGQTVTEATAALAGVGVTQVDTTPQVSATVPSGDVISCSISGSTATLVVSSGPAQVAVPDLAGMTVPAGTTALTNAGLRRGPVQRVDSDRPNGEILRTTPDAGVSVDPDTAVTLVVSNGSQTTVTVPDVIGKSAAAATTDITNAGLTVVTAEREFPIGSSEIGTVVSMSPVAGASVAGGSAVTITVGVPEDPGLIAP